MALGLPSVNIVFNIVWTKSDAFDIIYIWQKI